MTRRRSWSDLDYDGGRVAVCLKPETKDYIQRHILQPGKHRGLASALTQLIEDGVTRHRMLHPVEAPQPDAKYKSDIAWPDRGKLMAGR